MKIGDIGILQGLPWNNGELAEIVDEVHAGQIVLLNGKEIKLLEPGWDVHTLATDERLAIRYYNIRPIDDPDQDDQQETDDADALLYRENA